jgi:hypothetical protein
MLLLRSIQPPVDPLLQLLQYVSFGGQLPVLGRQLPEMHDPEAQGLLQVPQWLALLVVSTHTPPQRVS